MFGVHAKNPPSLSEISNYSESSYFPETLHVVFFNCWSSFPIPAVHNRKPIVLAMLESLRKYKPYSTLFKLPMNQLEQYGQRALGSEFA